jgi:hypothetical protein
MAAFVKEFFYKHACTVKSECSGMFTVLIHICNQILINNKGLYADIRTDGVYALPVLFASYD